ncbi:hypothetical protein ACFQL8_20715 [Streptomyces goshikiensis]|uniref:hypothetical protein n=1 Tax=Streptomyces goshikiensis TaxID=1942 RepID=UPI0016775C87|nr:hypothetical protein [Streptomyces goshikiensis]GHD80794.1 hypothetical protein GCM10010336_65010 [Streptomyces goshikiensis]
MANSALASTSQARVRPAVSQVKQVVQERTRRRADKAACIAIAEAAQTLLVALVSRAAEEARRGGAARILPWHIGRAVQSAEFRSSPFFTKTTARAADGSSGGTAKEARRAARAARLDGHVKVNPFRSLVKRTARAHGNVALTAPLVVALSAFVLEAVNQVADTAGEAAAKSDATTITADHVRTAVTDLLAGDLQARALAAIDAALVAEAPGE